MPRRILLSLLLVLLGLGRALAAEEAPKPADEDYYELYKLLADTIDQVERNYVTEVDRRKLFEAAIKGVLSELDPYSSYISPEELSQFRSNVEAEFGGIGVQVGKEGLQLKVISPLIGSPAYRAGILAGDRILEIDGQNADKLTLDEAVKLLKGKDGTSVTLVVQHPGRPGKASFDLVREVIHVETVLGDHRGSDDAWDFMIDPEQHIGYIRVTAFSRDTAREIRRVMEELQSRNLRGLVLDLRFNPGGLLSAAIEVADLFVSQGRIVSTKGRSSPERAWEAEKAGTFEGFPMVVLVNRYSASASEIVAACLQDHGRAVVMGERTWGKGSVQNVIELEHGQSALKLTTSGYLRPSGKNIHRFEGAKPDDSWGVEPNQGYELKLGDSEVVGLLRDRRLREIVQPRKQAAAELHGELPPDGEKPEPARPDGSEASEAKPGEGEPLDQSPKKEPPDDFSTPAVEPSSEAEPAFVDRQLKMAVEYLNTELARAD